MWHKHESKVFALIALSAIIVGVFGSQSRELSAIDPKAFSTPIDMKGYKIQNLGSATADTDAVTRGAQRDSSTQNTGTLSDARLSANVSLLGPSIGLTTEVTGTLPVANGGTGSTSFTAYSLLAGGTTNTGAVQSLTTGTSGQVLLSAGSGALPAFRDRVFEVTVAGSGTWTNPKTLSGNPYVAGVVELIGGGGGGGGGRLSAAGTGGSGGGGGAAGSYVTFVMHLASLPNTMDYFVGGGGLGGGPGINATGTSGASGGTTTFGDTSGSNGTIYVKAQPGAGGGGGTTAAGTGGAQNSSSSVVRGVTYAAAGGTAGGVSTVSQASLSSGAFAGPTPGGGGGGTNTSGVASAGGRSAKYSNSAYITPNGEASGAAGGAIATNGQAGSAVTATFSHSEGIGGGGGGGAAAGQTAGNGGAGYRGGGGGGGGGAAGAGANAGSGGNGGDGVLRITYY